MLSRRQFTLGATALSMTALGLSACGRPSAQETEDLSSDVGLTDSGLPVVTDELTLTFGGAKSALAPRVRVDGARPDLGGGLGGDHRVEQ